MSEATQTSTLEQSLNKTDFGHVLYEYRKLFLGALLAILVGVTGWVLWNESKKSSALNDSVKVFEFQTTVWKDAQAGKIPPADLVKSFNDLDKAVQTAPVMLPVALEMGKFLFEKEAYAEADSVLSKVEGNVKNPVGSFFVGLQRSVVQEKMGNIDGAIASLEALAKNKEVLMPAKISVDLARLYIAKGDKGKAQTQLDYVINTFPNDEQAKVAKLYQAQMAQ
ncbi:MAG TPA: tetratricopeptide repeat protein [Bacteriovoracaceae bacterium]|nr:tetratricopeptide repeat protein [Bacteriovoracaceae bacterium]